MYSDDDSVQTSIDATLARRSDVKWSEFIRANLFARGGRQAVRQAGKL